MEKKANISHLVRTNDGVYHVELDEPYIISFLKQVITDLPKSDPEKIQSFCSQLSLDSLEPATLLFILRELSRHSVSISASHYKALFDFFQKCTCFFEHKADVMPYAFLKFNRLDAMAEKFRMNIWNEEAGKTNHLSVTILNGLVEAVCTNTHVFPLVNEYLMNEIAHTKYQVQHEEKPLLDRMMQKVIQSSHTLEKTMKGFMVKNKNSVSWDVEIEFLENLVNEIEKKV